MGETDRNETEKFGRQQEDKGDISGNRISQRIISRTIAYKYKTLLET